MKMRVPFVCPNLLPLACALALIGVPWGAVGKAEAQCLLCAPGKSDQADKPPAIPLTIAITTHLEFARLARIGSGGGAAEIDPQSGQRRLAGTLTDLGGMALNGTAELTGEPFRAVTIALPARVVLTAANGSEAVLEEMVTDLPPQPRLDAHGRLTFRFGGALKVGDDVRGQLRGRIAISADYD